MTNFNNYYEATDFLKSLSNEERKAFKNEIRPRLKEIVSKIKRLKAHRKNADAIYCKKDVYTLGDTTYSQLQYDLAGLQRTARQMTVCLGLLNKKSIYEIRKNTGLYLGKEIVLAVEEYIVPLLTTEKPKSEMQN